jgi:hypothetical protein
MIDLPPQQAIVRAIEEVESKGQWWVISKGGCVGVMQICPKWSKYKRRDLLNPIINRMEGERMLTYWLGRSGQNMRKALAAYNCGNGGLKGKCGASYAIKVINVARKYMVKEDNS